MPKVTERKLLQDRLQNITNGNDAEVLVASQLIAALNGEVSWGSRNEDGRKIDLICSYDHPWIEKERLLILVQVKSGGTYGVRLKDGFTLKAKAKESAMRTTHPILLCWVDRKSSDVFWAYLPPSSKPTSQNFGLSHLVTPALRFDLALKYSRLLPGKTGGAGIVIKERLLSLADLRVQALNAYRSYRSNGLFFNCLGLVEVTRIGWRHMFRKSRGRKNKESSLQLIKYLPKIILDKPSGIYLADSLKKVTENFEHRLSEYVIIFDKVNLHADTVVPIRVVIRVLEEIYWPLDWNRNATQSQNVQRRLVLLSCFYKKRGSSQSLSL